MASSYSQDLRGRVIDAVEKEGMSRRAAGLPFGVSESSAIKSVRRWRLTGSRAPAGTGGPGCLYSGVGVIRNSCREGRAPMSCHNKAVLRCVLRQSKTIVRCR
jgi:hypothetical protein